METTCTVCDRPAPLPATGWDITTDATGSLVVERHLQPSCALCGSACELVTQVVDPAEPIASWTDREALL